jgi:hypothetical protein
MSGVESIEFQAHIFNDDILGPPVRGLILLSLRGTEVLNFLRLSMNMKIPEKNFVIICLPTPEPSKKTYRILEEDKDLRRYAQLRWLEFMLYPPTQFLRITCPGGRATTGQFDSKKSASELVEDICAKPGRDASGQWRGFFNLTGPIAYSLYKDPQNMIEPVPMSKSIVEYDPFVTVLWLQRR